MWGLWLSSLVVGYGLLLTGIFTPVLRGDPSGWGMGQDGPPDRAQRTPPPALNAGRRWIVRLFELPVALFYFYPWEAMRRVAGLGPRR